MKKFFVVLLVLSLIVLTIVGFSEAATTEKKPFVIAFIQRTMDAPYYVAMWDTMARLAVEKGFELVALNSAIDTATHAKQVEDIIARKVDFVIINAVDPGTEKDVDQAIIDAGIPLIFIDTFVEGMDTVTIVRSDNENIGKMAAKSMAARFEGKEFNLALLEGMPTDVLVGPARQGGFLAGLDAAGAKYKIVARGYAKYNQELGMKVTEDFLVAHSEINAIFANNDSMALGGLAAATAAGRKDILFTGIDGQKEAMKAIKDGGATGQYVSTGLNSPVLAAEDCINAALQILTGEKKKGDFPKTSFTKAVGIDYTNIDQYYDPKSIF
jgi:ABC-type sugar transport system substrate-binding protein